MTLTLEALPASDGWGFVGVVKIGEIEVYRTVVAHAASSDAQTYAAEVLAGGLGSFLAGAEWRMVRERAGHVPLRRDLRLGLQPQREQSG